MHTAALEQLHLPRRRPRRATTWLWREWCFFRVVSWHISLRLAVLLALMLTGGILFQTLEPEKHHSLPKGMYYTFALIFGNTAEDFPTSPILQVMYFVVPALGLAVILEALVDCAAILRDRRRNERRWCRAMAKSLSNHIILIGLGKLGYRVFKLLRQLGEPVAVIEHNPQNQFLEDIRRDGSPLFVGDARREAFLADANAAGAKCIILATNHDLTNLEVALDARQINPNIRVVLRMFDQNMADKVRAAFDLQNAMSQSAISAPAFVMAALEGSIVSSITVDDQLLVVQRWRVRAGGSLCGKTVAEVMAEFGVCILQRRVGAAPPELMPRPDVALAAGDELLVQGTFECLTKLQECPELEAAGSGPIPAA